MVCVSRNMIRPLKRYSDFNKFVIQCSLFGTCDGLGDGSRDPGVPTSASLRHSFHKRFQSSPGFRCSSLVFVSGAGGGWVEFSVSESPEVSGWVQSVCPRPWSVSTSLQCRKGTRAHVELRNVLRVDATGMAVHSGRPRVAESASKVDVPRVEETDPAQRLPTVLRTGDYR